MLCPVICVGELQLVALPGAAGLYCIKHNVQVMKSLPAAAADYMMFDDGERELLEGMEGTSVQEKMVDADFYNRFEDDFDEDDMALPK